MVLGKWKLDKNENFDEYMSKIGVNWALRKAGSMASSTTEITKEGDNYRINTQSTVKSSNEAFTPGVERDVTTMDGRKVKATLTVNGETLMVVEKWDGKQTSIEFSVKDGQLVLTLKYESVTCVRTHKKL